MRIRCLHVVLTAILGLSVRLIGQSSAMPPAEQLSTPPPSAATSTDKKVEDSAGTFSTGVREVNVVFSASNWHGHFVSNLSPSDVRVFDNGKQPESLTYFFHEADLPLRVGILIDASGSVEHLFGAEQKAAAIFLKETLRPSDSASVNVFGERSRTVQDFTSDLESLTAAVRRLQPTTSATAIYDAVKSACEKLGADRDSTLRRRALILITDGEDNLSRTTIGEAIDAALESEVVVFALNTHPVPQTTQPILRKLAESTGGEAFYSRGAGQLKVAFRRVNDQLRHQYVLAYKPPNWQADHSFHKIRVTTRRLDVWVHCRKGYYATP